MSWWSVDIGFIGAGGVWPVGVLERRRGEGEAKGARARFYI